MNDWDYPTQEAAESAPEGTISVTVTLRLDYDPEVAATAEEALADARSYLASGRVPLDSFEFSVNGQEA